MLDLPPWPDDVAEAWPLLRLVTDRVVTWTEADGLTLRAIAALTDALNIRADANDAATIRESRRVREQAERRRR